MNKYEKLKCALESSGSAAAYEFLAESGGGLTELSAFLYEQNDQIRFRALKVIGQMSEKMTGEGRLEELREMVRRLLWTMNHESGATGWHSADAVGHIINASKTLAGEYVKLLILYINVEPFEASVCCALSHVAEKHNAVVKEFSHELKGAAASENLELKFWVNMALHHCGDIDKEHLVEIFKAEKRTLKVFDNTTETIIETTPIKAIEILM